MRVVVLTPVVTILVVLPLYGPVNIGIGVSLFLLLAVALAVAARR